MWERTASSCAAHLNRHMRYVLGKEHTAFIKVTYLATPHEGYVCDCGTSAKWYLRIEVEKPDLNPEENPRRIELEISE